LDLTQTLVGEPALGQRLLHFLAAHAHAQPTRLFDLQVVFQRRFLRQALEQAGLCEQFGVGVHPLQVAIGDLFPKGCAPLPVEPRIVPAQALTVCGMRKVTSNSDMKTMSSVRCCYGRTWRVS